MCVALTSLLLQSADSGIYKHIWDVFNPETGYFLPDDAINQVCFCVCLILLTMTKVTNIISYLNHNKNFPTN